MYGISTRKKGSALYTVLTIVWVVPRPPRVTVPDPDRGFEGLLGACVSTSPLIVPPLVAFARARGPVPAILLPDGVPLPLPLPAPVLAAVLLFGESVEASPGEDSMHVGDM